MNIRLKIGHTNYLLSSENNPKLIEFAGMFFSPEINTFQHYETSEPIGISMADEPLKTISPVQEGLEKLIQKAINRPKEVKSA